MVPGRKSTLPRVYGDTPSFLGADVVAPHRIPPGFDVLVMGVPWEGTITWGSYSGCELATKSIRHAAARYGGFLPDYDINLFDYLRIGDCGDVPTDASSPEETMGRIFERAGSIYRQGGIPFVLGGDHSISPEVVRALAEHDRGGIGVIHFDSHLDNSRCFGEDLYPRCGPLYRIAQIEGVRTESIVQLGIRGPRNAPSQLEYAREIGATVYTTHQIRNRGMQAVLEEALSIARKDTEHLYVTICSDVIDAAFNPGGPADFNGLFPHELLHSLYTIGQGGIAGLDYVEVYPVQDPQSFSSHLAAWALIYGMAGLAARKKARLGVSLKEESRGKSYVH